MLIGPVAGLEFNPEVIGPTLVLGTAAAGLYGLLAVALVLTYRVSRTIGFIQGGLALFGTFFYWWLAGPKAGLAGPARMGRVEALLVVMVIGALVGVAYGFAVTGKLANWPRVRITTFSLGWLLALATVVVTVFGNQVQGAASLPMPSVFGRGYYTIFDATVSRHQVVTVIILAVLVAVLSLLLLRTRTGVFIRAIADDPDASRWVGIPLNWVGTGVYGFSGALSAFAGVMLASALGPVVLVVLVVFLRALTMSVLGGFMSLPLALVGCLILGIGENSLTAELFGPLTGGQREIIVMGVLFGLLLLINRYRPIRAIESAGQ